MPSALSLRTDYSPADLRRLAKKTKDNQQSRLLLSLDHGTTAQLGPLDLFLDKADRDPWTTVP